MQAQEILKTEAITQSKRSLASGGIVNMKVEFRSATRAGSSLDGLGAPLSHHAFPLLKLFRSAFPCPGRPKCHLSSCRSYIVSFLKPGFAIRPFSFSFPLFGTGPDLVQESSLLAKAVHRVISLAHGAYEASERKRCVLSGCAALGGNVGNGDLDRGVVLGADDAVGGAALAGDVAARDIRYP